MVEKGNDSPDKHDDKKNGKPAKQTSLKTAIAKGAETALGMVEQELENGTSMFSAMAGKAIGNALN